VGQSLIDGHSALIDVDQVDVLVVLQHEVDESIDGGNLLQGGAGAARPQEIKDI